MLYIVLFLAFFISKNAFAEQPEVKIDQGILKGVFMETVSHRKISAFLGVPYAKPPIGNLRFREPQIPSNWLGVWNATSLPPDCLQYAPINEPIHGSEDCLYLSIFVPEEPKDHKNLLNVLVNIHGGGFMYYSSSNYGPEYLLDKDVILVNVNYRLGVLGFMSTGDLEVPGNNGLKDQNLALRWVQKNIRRFGGNPEKVTLTGLSAGGASTQFHMISPKSKGLVQRAIVASGSVLCNWVQTENAKEKAVALSHHLGCETSDVKKMVECLRKRPGEHLVASTKLFMVWLYYPFSPFGTVIEPSHPNAFIDHPPSFYLKNGHFNDIPVLFSLTADEGLFPGLELMGDDAKLKFLDQNWISLSPHVLDYNFTSAVEHHEKISSEILKEYFGSGGIKDQKNILIELMGDRFFNTAVSKAAKLQAAKSKSPVYAFVFSHVVKKGIQGFSNLSREIYPGTAHGDDVHHVLKLTSNSADVLEKSMTERMVNLYFDFMEGKKFPENWEQVKDNLPAFSYMNIASEDVSADRFVIEKDFGRENFWTGINLREDGMSKDFHDEL